MLEIEPADIANLNDTDLRTLLGLLCEAELAQRNLPVSAVTYGGNQNTADGGVDVRVDLPQETSGLDFILRPVSVLQSKKSDLTAKDIELEMCPIPPGSPLKKGVFRDSLSQLALANGAYIIASGASLSATQLKNRLQAMRKVVEENVKVGSLATDFYDRTRLATWVRQYPGRIAWVRDRCGRKMDGWDSYGCWTLGDSIESEFLFDDKSRISVSGATEATSTIEGLQQLRLQLHKPTGIARLVGLSGVGKTRFAQALFDSRVGEDALPDAAVLYADMGSSPDPPPVHMVGRLNALGQRAIVVVDNCGADLHGELVKAVSKTGSKVSLLTIEYDIREDTPESTEVYELEVASTDLVAKLIGYRRPDLSKVDQERIAEHSGGNARVALAVAAALTKGQSMAGLTDAELFRRLFWQRHEIDKVLERVAQACALVYSFRVDDSAEGSELSVLASLAETAPAEVYRKVAELGKRGLAQKRAVWRAILPHLVANKLAQQALDSIPVDKVWVQLLKDAPKRMAVSFCHRLSFLHDNETVVGLVEGLLQPEGILGNIGLDDDESSAMYLHTAPVSPGAWLSALERNLQGNEPHILERWRIVHIVRSVAYDSNLFKRAAHVLIALALSEKQPHQRPARDILGSLFHLYLSGTHATAEQRIGVILSLLESGDAEKQGLGCQLLGIFVQAGHSMNAYQFEFGSHSRNHGYEPETWEDVRSWFGCALQLIKKFGNQPGELSDRVRSLFAEAFRNIWNHSTAFDALEETCLRLRSYKFWPEGLSAVRKTLRYDADRMPEHLVSQLGRIADGLKPTTPAERIRASFGSRRFWDEEIKQEDEFELGVAAATDHGLLDEILPDLVRDSGSARFGAGLASASSDHEHVWLRLVEAFAACPQRHRRIHVLSGYLQQFQGIAPGWVDRILDGMIDDPLLGPEFIDLQTSLRLDDKAVLRVLKAATTGRTEAHRFQKVHWWETDGLIFPDEAICQLARQFAGRAEDYGISIELLGWRLKQRAKSEDKVDAAFLEIARSVLAMFPEMDGSDKLDYDLGVVAKYCLQGQDGEALTRELCQKLKRRSQGDFGLHKFHELLGRMVNLHPEAVLDELLGDPEEHTYWLFLELIGWTRPNPLDSIPVETVLSWADREPESRLIKIAELFRLYHRPEEEGPLEWTDLAVRLLQVAIDKERVLAVYTDRLSPRSWSGSLAETMERRLVLFDSLASLCGEGLFEVVRDGKNAYLEEIENARADGRREQMRRHESFE
jgi:hypothetical protein